MEEIVVTTVVFFAAYHIIKLLSEHLLKRKLIKGGHFENVSILDNPKPSSEEVNKYPSLKWGLVALMAGLGFILIEILRLSNVIEYHRDMGMGIGILLVFIALGFLIYFVIMNMKKKAD